jgi:hypothetical protein
MNYVRFSSTHTFYNMSHNLSMFQFLPNFNKDKIFFYLPPLFLRPNLPSIWTTSHFKWNSTTFKLLYNIEGATKKVYKSHTPGANVIKQMSR